MEQEQTIDKEKGKKDVKYFFIIIVLKLSHYIVHFFKVYLFVELKFVLFLSGLGPSILTELFHTSETKKRSLTTQHD